MTNYDYIRSLSPETMAEEMERSSWCRGVCIAIEKLNEKRLNSELVQGLDISTWCIECKLNWLKSERKGDTNDT